MSFNGKYALVALSLGVLFSCSDDNEKTLVLQLNGSEEKDAAIFGCVPCGYNDNNYANNVEFSALAATNSSNTSIARSLIEFDLSEILSSATVVNAKLSLFHFTSTNGDHTGANSAKLLRITQA